MGSDVHQGGEQDADLNQEANKEANKESLSTDLNRRRKTNAAENLESVRSVVDHLHFASCELTAIAPTLEDAARDVVQVALHHNSSAHGSPILWNVVMKHIIQKVGELAAKIEGQTSPPAASFSSNSNSSTHPRKE